MVNTMNRNRINRFFIPLFFGIACFWAQIACGAVDDVIEARALAARVVPREAGRFSFEMIPAEQGRDVYELESQGDKIFIRGNSSNSMAVGLNHYLKYYCKTSVSWYLDDPVELPDRLPPVPEKERIVARTDKRFFLNYCTFGYSMPWWQWDEWERFIDWMAMNGVNMPLAITGQEAVWYKVWREMGLEDREIRNYFTGPAHLPWHRMTNFDRWGGPLPHSWLDHQAELQKKIVARERALNMTPVLPAFAGHVPPELKRLYKDAKISRMSSWGGFRDEFRSYFLDPLDPLFSKIQSAFLKEQERLYGTDHIYGVDPFNEITPPSWEPEYLARVARQIYGTMTQCDPKATWLQMTWLFYFDRKDWTNPRIDAFVNAVPKGRMILLDYFAENTEVWKMTESYFGQPFLWCYLGNFGGNTMLAGNLRETGKRIENAFACGGANMNGLGSTLEGLDVNPFMYEYVFEKAWNRPVSDDEWIRAWADRRAGKADPRVRKAWADLLDRIYVKTAQLGQGTLTNARPCLKGHGNWTTNPGISYKNEDLFRIWETMLSAEGTGRDAYGFDVVNIGRQVLGNYFLTVRDRFAEAYSKKDKEALRKNGEIMSGILRDMNLLLSCHPVFSLDRWLSDASRISSDAGEQAYFRQNARCLISTWGEQGQSLNDYANRSLAGMMESYYGKRWNYFIDQVCLAVEQDRKFDEKSCLQKILDLEQEWVEQDELPVRRESPDATETARSLMEKYRGLIL